MKEFVYVALRGYLIHIPFRLEEAIHQYSYNLAALVKDSLPPLPPHNIQLRLDVPGPVSCNPFAVSPQPPSLHVQR